MRLGPALALTLIVGCYDAAPPLGIECGPMGECPSGQECDAITHTCLLPTELRTWRDDTAADFNQPGVVLQNAIVEPTGFVGPIAYATGQIRLSGVAGDHLPMAGAGTWADVDLARTGTSFTPHFDLDYSTNVPAGVGLTTSDNVTVLLEGEINLDAPGAWRFELRANDGGFFELAPPGGNFTRVVSDMNVGTIATYTVTTPGWYRFRGAFADAAMFMSYKLRYDPPNISGGLIEIPSERVRARVDDLRGYAFDGYDDDFLFVYINSSLVASPLDLMLASQPFGIPLGLLTLSGRFTAQILIDTEGDYGFSITSHNGHRAWLDDVQIANNFGASDATTAVPPVHLTAGWHDFVIDVTKSGGMAQLSVSMKVTSGPTWVGQAIPLDHVRPVFPRGRRATSDYNTASTTITDGGSIARSVFLDFPSNVTPLALSQEYEFNHPLQAQVGIVLAPPVGQPLTLVAPGALSGAGQHVGAGPVPTADNGVTWTLTASDNTVDAMTGTLDKLAITLLYAGGTAPFPSTYRYESAPKDLGNVVGIGAVTWAARQGNVKLQIRSCDDPTTCEAEAWVDVATSGETPALTAKQFVQYAVDFTSNGDVPTALDWVELAYSARP